MGCKPSPDFFLRKGQHARSGRTLTEDRAAVGVGEGPRNRFCQVTVFRVCAVLGTGLGTSLGLWAEYRQP